MTLPISSHPLSDEAAQQRLAELAEWGVDLGLITVNLQRSPEERLDIVVGRNQMAIQASQSLGMVARSELRNGYFASPLPLFVALAQAQTATVLVGNLAAALLGTPIASAVVELCIATHPSNLAAFLLAVLPFQPYVDGQRLTRSTLENWLAQGGAPVRVETTLVPIIVMARVAGIGTYERVRTFTRTISFDGITVNVLDLPGIITNKLALGAAEDRFSLPQIEATLRLREQI